MLSEAYRTYHANQALELSELINLQFARIQYGASDPWLIRMREPDGPSTDSGRKARQPLILVRNHGEEAGFVFGFVDTFKRTVDIRSYPTLRTHHQRRFGFAFGMTRNEYHRLTNELRRFLEGQAFETRILNPSITPAHRLQSSIRHVPLDRERHHMVSPSRWLLVPPILLSATIGFLSCYLLFELRVLPL